MSIKLFLACAAAIAAASVSALSAAPVEEKTIVVTGHSLKQTEQALKDCIARHCPPKEDIDATLAHAENLFVAGNYKAARSTTLASISRNSKYAKELPVDVSDLYRANGRISAHLGEGADFERSTTTMNRILDAGLGRKDPRAIAADLEVASMYASMRRTDRARQVYEQVERDARSIGREDIATIARVRHAWLHQIEADNYLARKALEEIARDQTPGRKVGRLTALILLSRLDRLEGKPDSSEALLAQLRAAASPRPVLLYSPAVEMSSKREIEGDSGSVTNLMATDNFDDRWVDIGFWVGPDGKVTDAEVLRSRGPLTWVKPLLRSIEGRLYAPGSDPEGSYRVERYSYTSLWKTDRTGTHLRQRAPDARIEFLDLTAEPAPAPTKP